MSEAGCWREARGRTDKTSMGRGCLGTEILGRAGLGGEQEPAIGSRDSPALLEELWEPVGETLPVLPVVSGLTLGLLPSLSKERFLWGRYFDRFNLWAEKSRGWLWSRKDFGWFWSRARAALAACCCCCSRKAMNAMKWFGSIPN